MIFLIVYDATSSRLIEVREYPDADRQRAADDLKVAQEEHFKELEQVEIALFESPSLETLERTHSRYFKSLAELGASLDISSGVQR